MRILFVLMTLLVGCSTASNTKDEKAIDEKVAHSTSRDRDSLRGTMQEAVDNSSLSEAKKQEVRKILEINKARATELFDLSYRYRGTLIQELLSNSMSRKRVEILKKDIEKVEALRLKNTFDTVENISKIVSDHDQKDVFAPHLMNIERAYR